MRFGYSIGLIATVASAAIAQDCGSIIGSLDTAFNNDVAIEAGYAYIAADLHGLKIVDISDPTAPTLTGTLDTAGRALGIFVADSIAYLADEDGLVVIDATDPTSPELLDAIATPGGRAQNVFVSDGVAGVADASSGLQLFDVSDPASVSALGAYPSAFTMHDVLLSDGYAYLAGNYAFQVVDISDPTTPSLAGEFEDIFEARGMAFYDNGDVAMADQEGWVWWIDVSEPSNPDDLWSTTSGDAVWDVATGQGATLAVDRSFGTIEVFDMLVPDRPRDFARAPAGPEPIGIFYADGLAYIANRNFGLTIVDLAGCLPCHADLDGDGDLTIFDFLAFQNLFDASNPLADFDGDGAFTIFDFLAFQNDFDVGCV